MVNHSYQWAVVGAGPAGIAAVGKLIDHGVEPQQILWLDPYFQVGDFGRKWYEVSSNTKVGLFIQFFNNAKSFHYDKRPKDWEIHSLEPDSTCPLSLAAEPLRWITTQLQQQVTCETDKILSLELCNRQWTLRSKQKQYQAKQVILAIGSEPKSLSHNPLQEIPLKTALTPSLLANAYDKTKDTIAVFGSSHSAIIIIESLIKQGAHKIINFYQSPLRYAVYTDQGILYDNTGLKGQTAQWAKENLHGTLPKNLERYTATEQHLTKYLPSCDKAIYAVGFEQRDIAIQGLVHVQHDAHTGIIAPGLFGLGIAFPEKRIDNFGLEEHMVGLWKFMDYVNRVMPIWLAYTA